MRTWLAQYEAGTLGESKRGKHSKRVSAMDSREFREELKNYVTSHATTKGQPNLTGGDICRYLEEVILPRYPKYPQTVSQPTVCAWLKVLEIQWGRPPTGKFDGHDLPETVERRRAFKEEYEEYRAQAHSKTPNGADVDTIADVKLRANIPMGGIAPVQGDIYLLYYHDETTFAAYDCQSRQYYGPGMTCGPGTGKGQGPKVMLSAFVSEEDGLQELHKGVNFPASVGAKARSSLLQLTVGKKDGKTGGYFDSPQFLAQLQHAMDIHDANYPGFIAVFVLDNSPVHRKKADDALNVNRMNAGPGGKVPDIRSTSWRGEPQEIGRRGLRAVLRGRGMLRPGMTLDEMREALGACEDFANEKSMAEQAVEARGHRVLFLPKFHCEFNPIEHCWRRMKDYTRKHCDRTIGGLRRRINQALKLITAETVRKDARLCRTEMRLAAAPDAPPRNLRSHPRPTLVPRALKRAGRTGPKRLE
jgi:hypothetical protein